MGFYGKGAKTVRWFILAFGGLKRQKTRHTERSALHTLIQFLRWIFVLQIGQNQFIGESLK